MNILVARTSEEIEFAFEKLSASKIIGCDTETSGLSAKYGRLFSIQFSDGDFNALVPISEGVQLGKLGAIFEDAAIIKIFHNAKFDLDFLRENGYSVHNVFDTMIAEKVLTRGANQSASLAETLYRYFAVDLDKSQRAKFNRSWNGIWTEELVDYALSDVVYLPQLMGEQNQWIEKLGLRNVYTEQIAKMYSQFLTNGDRRDVLP
ncbi:MAG: hypothetical protein H7070_02720 [Saprospiraceae bacterium]|nr:hypothetical protein [Pyrinomonadaceae bacterium]